jgi:2-polyprenyl-3-methyl-5-hydroxy-6-metoxy-1,4-benzoquinol methylase
VVSSAGGWTAPEITDDILQRYRDNYGIPSGVTVTKDMVQQHVELEWELKETLLHSVPANRSEVWADSYDTLYRSLPWLADLSSIEHRDDDVEYGHFLKLIPPGSRVIEIGSGVGLLAKYLMAQGRPCVATEISAERGIREDGTIEWHNTDGIHLDDFEPAGSYDTVLSSQVIEHFHPTDVKRHFRGALALLRPGGSYVFETPHVFMGPADLSRVFSMEQASFMHLKEYTHRELGMIAREVGFRKISAVYIPPGAVRRRLPLLLRSRLLYFYLSALERIFSRIRAPRLVLRVLLFHGNVFLVATK